MKLLKKEVNKIKKVQAAAAAAANAAPPEPCEADAMPPPPSLLEDKFKVRPRGRAASTGFQQRQPRELAPASRARARHWLPHPAPPRRALFVAAADAGREDRGHQAAQGGARQGKSWPPPSPSPQPPRARASAPTSCNPPQPPRAPAPPLPLHARANRSSWDPWYETTQVCGIRSMPQSCAVAYLA